METVTVLSRVVQTLLLGLFLDVPVLDSVQVGTPRLSWWSVKKDTVLTAGVELR